MEKRTWISVALSALAVLPYPFVVAQQTTEKPKVGYGSDIVPVLRAHCVSCHSGSSAAGKLDLTSNDAIKRMVVPGDPAKSVLLQRIKGLGGLPRMPMGFPALTKEETTKFEAWILAGAKFDNSTVIPHWAYVTPKRPDVPNVGAGWVRNPIDAFVFERLKKQGLKPSPAADKETLIRRVTLDLTGLPPTLAEIDAFLLDKRPDAYERVVDRLLASKQYGVKQARGWLDLARYADSNGYEKDLRRTAWKYRDWVVNAFNANMPYDKFTIEQLAGDLLPDATLDDKVATGFQRNTMFNQEGGVDQEEAHFSVILDRAEVTSTVWLGSTLMCARCHDHKYDPFSQKDYYRMAAFYSNTEVYPRGPKEVGEEKWFEAEIPVPSKEQIRRRGELRTAITTMESDLRAIARRATASGEAQAWADRQSKLQWTIIKPISAKAEEGVTLEPQPDGSLLAKGPTPIGNEYRLDLGTAKTAIGAVRLEALPDPSLPNQGPGRAGNGNFVVPFLTLNVDGKPAAFVDEAADFVQREFRVEGIGVKDKTPGWALDGGLGKPHELVLPLAETIAPGAHLELIINQRAPYDYHTLGRFRVSATEAADPIPAVFAQRFGSGKMDVGAAYTTYAGTFRVQRARKAELQMQLDRLNQEIPTALVMREKPGKKVLTTWVRRRGEFLNKTEEVSAGTPEVLPPLKKTRADRLDLAKWLVRVDNPLTARVEVNRMWEDAFGRGLVETSEDFGTRGSKPTHPELLDWLATEFIARKWDMKAMQRLIVTSATYRQSSATNAKLQAKDPENRFLARGPRFRLSAEDIRDTALAASGLLSKQLGGPSVFPYQPPNTWNNPFGDDWSESAPKDLYRRSIYTFWKRTAPYPAFMAFDATSRESCTVRRIRTNTPLQALTMMNNREMMEASAALGKQMQKAGVAAGFRLCTGRKPEVAEQQRLEGLLSKLRTRYAKDPSAAKKMGGPELAAYTMVGSVLLNLDETVTKG